VALSAAIILLCLAPSCQQREPVKAQMPAPVDTAAQKREDEFRWKERCAIAAERFDKLFASNQSAGPRGRAETEVSVSEVFYSTPRNSCVCEVSAVGKRGNHLTLYDCLTREYLVETLLNPNAENWKSVLDAWKHQKDVLQH
jgi:hypothetical protein